MTVMPETFMDKWTFTSIMFKGRKGGFAEKDYGID